MNHPEREIRKAMFGDNYPPIINFYDHATPDEEKTKASGRPRYKAVPYISIKPTAPDLVVKDLFSRAVTPEDKLQFPEQWAKYEARKQRIKERNPAIEVMPGMTVEAHAEFRELGLFDCKQLAEYDGDLAPYNYLKTIAKRVMEISHEHLPEEREPVRAEASRPEHDSAGPDWASGRTETRAENSRPQASQKESHQEKGFKTSYDWSISIPA